MFIVVFGVVFQILGKKLQYFDNKVNTKYITKIP